MERLAAARRRGVERHAGRGEPKTWDHPGRLSDAASSYRPAEPGNQPLQKRQRYPRSEAAPPLDRRGSRRRGPSLRDGIGRRPPVGLPAERRCAPGAHRTHPQARPRHLAFRRPGVGPRQELHGPWCGAAGAGTGRQLHLQVRTLAKNASSRWGSSRTTARSAACASGVACRSRCRSTTSTATTPTTGWRTSVSCVPTAMRSPIRGVTQQAGVGQAAEPQLLGS